MKTVIIFDDIDQIRFFVLDGLYTRFDTVYIDGWDMTEEMQELNDIMYHPDSGRFKHIEHCCFPTQAVKEGAQVIVCGILP